MEEIKLTHDGQLAIATAYSRKASKWKNGETTWSQFLQRLNKPTETSETVAEYKQMNEIDDRISWVANIMEIERGYNRKWRKK
ncbi:hypothetical protein [Jeotgalibaca arthritidis]|uniref:Uncharacterized protein n=1 Tax=Jeotgalibaca arthritidis TaxID=1868794 RepID=A0A6G7KBN4_9LACT|nr:hypothetical protein [Jeotgalibaca arthritidis]QII82611.1 hypothetical protein G7057_09325 [Jeotgalibaca arthritidis]